MTGEGPAIGELPSGDVCFVFTDVESSTSILRDVGDEAWTSILQSLQAIVRESVEAGGGVVVNTDGDGSFAAFPTAAGGVAACTAAQLRLVGFSWGDRTIRVRMGVHLGTAIVPVDDDYVALAVHRAARVSAAASGAQVLATADVVRAADASDQFIDLGLFSVRDFDGPVRLYGLEFDGVARVVPRVPPAFDYQVPSYRTGLVGRDTEIDDVLAAAQPGGLLTLVGPSGVGKTRLAVAALSQVSASCAVGPWFVDLSEAREAIGVGDVITDAIGCPPGTEIDAYLDDLLDGRRGYLVLNNCEHLIEAAAATAALLLDWCPSLSVIATSRTPLGLTAESLYSVAPLTVPTSSDPAAVLDSTAGRLFMERLTRLADDIDVDLSDVVAMCTAVDGMPLALELAAALCATQPVARIVADLDRADVVASLIEATLAILTADELRTLAAMTVPRQPVVPSLAEVTASALGASDATLAALVERSVLDQDAPGSYRFLVSLRERVAPHLQSADRAAVVHALFAECMSATTGDGLPVARLHPVAATATMLADDPDLTPVERQRIAVRIAPWWVARLGEDRARAMLERVVAADPDSAAAAAVHLTIADTYSLRATADTEQHLREAARLLGEHDAVDPALVERLRAGVDSSRNDERGGPPK